MWNSSGEATRAKASFLEAWEAAQRAGLEGLEVDAAHMLGIVSKGTPDALAWNQIGLKKARHSGDPKARALIPAMLNNTAWELHEQHDYEQALVMFQEAQAAWQERGGPEQIQIARWSVGRCLRSLGRYAEALALQRQLEGEHLRAGTTDGYVLEEIAENLAILEGADEARPYFSSACEALSGEAWLGEHEPDRLERLRARADA